MSQKPNIFEYHDSRLFLKDLLNHWREIDKKFSLRYFARVAGFKTHSFLKEVIEGRSRLSDESIEKFAKAFHFSTLETNFFRSLVHLNQAESSEKKQAHAREIIQFQAYRKVHPLREAQLRYLTKWYYVVIRELVLIPDFKEDYDWIAAKTLPAIEPREAKEAVEELIQLGLLMRDSNNQLRQTNQFVGTADEVFSTLVAEFHRQAMKRAADAIDLVAREHRDISSVTFRVSQDTAQKLKEKIQKFRLELMEEAARNLNPDGIYQLNLQLFPVTQYEDVQEPLVKSKRGPRA